MTHLGPPRTGAPIPDAIAGIARALTDAGLPAQALDCADKVI
jgi:hypothetical protein